jgi:hypothetical protein
MWKPESLLPVCSKEGQVTGSPDEGELTEVPRFLSFS